MFYSYIFCLVFRCVAFVVIYCSVPLLRCSLTNGDRLLPPRAVRLAFVIYYWNSKRPDFSEPSLVPEMKWPLQSRDKLALVSDCWCYILRREIPLVVSPSILLHFHSLFYFSIFSMRLFFYFHGENTPSIGVFILQQWANYIGILLKS